MPRSRITIGGSPRAWVTPNFAPVLLIAVSWTWCVSTAMAADAFSSGTSGGGTSGSGTSGSGTSGSGNTANTKPNGTAALTPSQVPEGLDAQLRVADALWLDRELTRFCAALGRDPKPLRRSLAESLYHTKTLDAIDTSRPAVFMWRKGNAPLQAIIPILADKRRQFVEEFGVMGSGEAPLVRVGDRDGTVVYTQNHVDGLREYRLLVMDSVAYLARNADECRKLAARAQTLLPVVGSGSAPVSLTCTGAWMRGRNLLAWSWTPRLPLFQWLPGNALISATQQAVVNQVDSVAFEVRPSTDGKARLSARVVAVTDTELAAWIATQQNQGSRLQTQMGNSDTAIKISTHVSWQDKLGQISQQLAPAQRTTYASTWTPAIDESWTQAFSIAERVVDAVWTLDVPSPGRHTQMLVLEQPRGEEQLEALDRIAGAILVVPATQRAITGHQATVRVLPAAAGRPTLINLLCSTSRHTLLVDGWNMSDSDVLARTEATARRLQQVSSAAGEPTIISVWCNLGRLVRLAPAIDAEVTIPDAIVSGAVRNVGVNALQIDLSVPLVEAALALGHLPDESRESRPTR